MSLDETNSNQKVSDIGSAYCRATLYSALALGFRPPTDEAIGRLRHRKTRQLSEKQLPC